MASNRKAGKRTGDPARERNDPAAVRVHLVVSSPHPSRIYDLVQGKTLIVGRSSDVDVTVDDSLVSRIHMQVERREKQVLVKDRGSANGTWVNGKMIDDTFFIRPGDEVKIGSTVLTIVEASALPVFRRQVMPPDELGSRLTSEISRARLHGDLCRIGGLGHGAIAHYELLAHVDQVRVGDAVAGDQVVDSGAETVGDLGEGVAGLHAVALGRRRRRGLLSGLVHLGGRGAFDGLGIAGVGDALDQRHGARPARGESMCGSSFPGGWGRAAHFSA